MRRKKAPDPETPAPLNDDQANAVGEISEDLPEEPLPTKGLPTLTTIELSEEEQKVKKNGKGMEKALEILDEYEKGVPPRNPHVTNYEE